MSTLSSCMLAMPPGTWTLVLQSMNQLFQKTVQGRIAPLWRQHFKAGKNGPVDWNSPWVRLRKDVPSFSFRVPDDKGSCSAARTTGRAGWAFFGMQRSRVANSQARDRSAPLGQASLFPCHPGVVVTSKIRWRGLIPVPGNPATRRRALEHSFVWQEKPPVSRQERALDQEMSGITQTERVPGSQEEHPSW